MMTVHFLDRARGFLMFLITGLLLFVFTPATANATTVTDAAKEGIDAILLIDTSGSMRFSDTSRTALEATKLFIDMMETRSSRIGIIAFTDTLQDVIPLTSINNPSDKEAIKKKVSEYAYYGYTDIGLSLKEAVELVTADVNPANSPMILLFTDGVIEISPNQNERTNDMSYNDVTNALETLAGNVPVYTIGLNYDDSVDIDFLRMVSGRTSARTYIAEEASSLPQIFNEIFADHIRSSLKEVATFITDGQSYTDVVVNINSVFVSEANIIMLSNRQLTDVKVFDPSGNQIQFDGDKYNMTRSNQYTMIKLVSPVEGDWVISAKGLPDDRVKVNLIYNYNIDIAISVTQDQMSGVLYDPNLPVQVNAGFLSVNANYSGMDLYDSAKAELRVFDNDMQLIENIPMTNTGSAFTVEYLPSNPQNVRLAVHVSNKDFDKSSVMVGVAYDIDAEPTPEPEAEPEPEPTAAPEPTAKPEPEPGKPPVFLYALLGIVLILGSGAGIAAVLLHKRPGTQVFSGYLEVRAMNKDGLYTSLEAPDLSTFAGRITLEDFLTTSLNGRNGSRILLVPIDTEGIVMSPGQQNGEPVICLENTNRCEISDDENNILTQKKIIWQDNQRLTFTNVDSEDLSKLEITYRIDWE